MGELKLSVVIPTYNRRNDLEECLNSLFNMRQLPDEVIVVDSYSNDGTHEIVKQFPVKYLRIRERSMVKARNVGLEHARGDVIAYIDDDVVVSKDWLISILEPYEDKKVGGVGGRVLPYGVTTKFYVWIKHCDIGKVLSNGMVLGNYDILTPEPILVDALRGCNMSFRRELLKRIKGFDENFVGNCWREDTDVCVRLRRLGYRLIYNPEAIVWHKFRRGKQLTYEQIYYTIHNHTYFYFKNFQPITPQRLFSFLLATLFPPPDYVIKSEVKIKLSPTLIVYAVKGLIDGWKALSRK